MSIPSWAVKGAKAVFVGDDDIPDWEPWETRRPTAPSKNDIVTITSVRRWPDDWVYCETLEFPALAIAIECLRPLVTRSQEQDVAQFHHLLVGMMPKAVDA
jgi:hypothetical protein